MKIKILKIARLYGIYVVKIKYIDARWFPEKEGTVEVLSIEQFADMISAFCEREPFTTGVFKYPNYYYHSHIDGASTTGTVQTIYTTSNTTTGTSIY